MKLGGKTVLVCDCEGTMSLDGKALAKACGADAAPAINTHLCRAQIDNFRAALGGDGSETSVIVACTQESQIFDETAEDDGAVADLRYVNIRERAGWSAEGKQAGAKIAALLAEASIDMPPVHTVAMTSAGACLVYGRDEIALAAAQQLAARLEVTLVLTQPGDLIPPRVTEVPIFRGTVRSASGHLGAFRVEVEDYAPLAASSRQTMTFDSAGARAESNCDLILDLTGGAPLFPAPEKRDGYFNPDPGNPAAVQKAIFELADMVGEFEKPRYVDFDPGLCAHGRSGLVGCARCLDACPASAITSAGDTVVIDPYICGGCGMCHSVCPTGAAAYAVPSGNAVLERLRALLGAYLKAGGKDPVLLLHDRPHGDDMISVMARFGRGLPANVLPFAVNEITQTGLDLLSGAFAYGTAQLRILVGPNRRDDTAALAEQVALINTILAGLGYGEGRAALLDEHDPDVIETTLYDLPRPAAPSAGSFLPMGNKRALTYLALGHLRKVAPDPVELLPLPVGAPFGSIAVDTEGCTMCLACVGACPAGALSDNPDRPRLSFTESACVQCGLCRTTCPEKVITLEPRLNFADDARGPVIKNEEEPFDCIRCGTPFGTKSSIERIATQLAGKHAMFAEGTAADVIKMCQDCRAITQTEIKDEVMAGAPRPMVRTTDDYLRERELENASGKPSNGAGGNGTGGHGTGGGTGG